MRLFRKDAECPAKVHSFLALNTKPLVASQKKDLISFSGVLSVPWKNRLKKRDAFEGKGSARNPLQYFRFSMRHTKMSGRQSLVGKLFQGESIKLQVMMLSHSHKPSHYVISLAAIMLEKKQSWFFFGFYLV